MTTQPDDDPGICYSGLIRIRSMPILTRSIPGT